MPLLRPPDNAGANPGPGLGPGPGPSAAAKRKVTDRCASLSRPARLKTQRVERPRRRPPARRRTRARILREDDSDITAKPATPDPRPAATAADPATSGGGGSGSGSEGGGIAGDALDTATALKGVLEGLALDGSCDGDDAADVPDGALAARCFGISAARCRGCVAGRRRVRPAVVSRGRSRSGKDLLRHRADRSNPPPPRWFAAARPGEDRPAGELVVPDERAATVAARARVKVSSSAG